MAERPVAHLTLVLGDPLPPLPPSTPPAATTDARLRILCRDVDKAGDTADAARSALWERIAHSPQHDWLLLAEEPERFRAQLPPSWHTDWPASVWVGTTASTQTEADARVPALLTLPAPVRFLLCEPLRESLDIAGLLPGYDRVPCPCPCHTHPGTMHVKPCCESGFLRIPRLPRLHWLIAGGDPAPDAPPVSPVWLRRLREQCREQHIGFYFSGWGAWEPARKKWFVETVTVPDEAPGTSIRMQRAGSSPHGATLDGWLHQDLPDGVPLR